MAAYNRNTPCRKRGKPNNVEQDTDMETGHKMQTLTTEENNLRQF